MKVEIITPTADPDRGGFGTRVHALVSMFARFADVRVVLTDWFDGERVPGVEYGRFPLRDGFWTRVRRLGTYYRTDFPERDISDPPDFVVVESLDYLGLHQYGPRVPLVLDEHNVYWNLLEYDLVTAPFFRGWLGRRRAVRRWLIPRLLRAAKRFESRAIGMAARTIVTSEADRAEVLAECPDAGPRLRVVPNCVDVERVPFHPSPAESNTVVFVGGFNYVPNLEAADFVCDVLAPQLPDARFLLVGPSPPIRVTPPNVRLTGHVPDLSSILQEAAVCIAPLSHGSGTRVKILTYLAAGRPVVATTKACEGLPVQDGRDLLVRDDPTGFIAGIRGLLADPRARGDLGRNGRRLVESGFDWRLHVDTLRRLSEELVSEGGLRRDRTSAASRVPDAMAGGSKTVPVAPLWIAKAPDTSREAVTGGEHRV